MVTESLAKLPGPSVLFLPDHTCGCASQWLVLRLWGFVT
jgi:hypothetical protein